MFVNVHQFPFTDQNVYFVILNSSRFQASKFDWQSKEINNMTKQLLKLFLECIPEYNKVELC